MKRRRPQADNQHDITATERKLLNLKADELRGVYANRGLPKLTLKREFRTALLTIINGKDSTVSEDVRESIIADISRLNDLTFSKPQECRFVTRAMPNANSLPGAMNSKGTHMSMQNGVASPLPGSSVRLKPLPFYDFLSELLAPSPLSASSAASSQKLVYNFRLTKEQIMMIHDNKSISSLHDPIYNVVVLLRLCPMDSSAEQKDAYPLGLEIKINDKDAPLPNFLPCRPGQTPRRPPTPVDATKLLKISPLTSNKVEIRWQQEQGKKFAIAAFLLHKRTSSELFQRVKKKGIKPSEYTCKMIKEKLEEDTDDEIATTMLRVSLMCPLSLTRMKTPCRALSCKHLQCFDALKYLEMNEHRPKWICPVCNEEILFDSLVIDGYFLDVTRSLEDDVTEVQLHKDGTWTKLEPEEEEEETKKKKVKVAAALNEIEIFSSSSSSSDEDDDDVDMRNNNKPGTSSKSLIVQQQTSLANGDIIDLTLDDDD